ncbi:hypothetical protein VaNZ11_012399 [Volvox africanus]|uniref:Uncharacterized protein n=1 Tax=Volvox africanus TaxID=51714 RepID=A0ABQ5SDT3_9CHLO|nr:hypothetical protein VaNZ11_012399 [Volvox africanus]
MQRWMVRMISWRSRFVQHMLPKAFSCTQGGGAGGQAPAIAGEEDFAGSAAASPAAPATSTCLRTGAAETAQNQPSADAPCASWQPLHDRYVELYRRRIRDRGPRNYRHPNGSLRPDPPEADVYSQVLYLQQLHLCVL